MNHHQAVKVLATEALSNKPITQKVRLLEYLLKHGTISSPLIAWQELGIYRLSHQILRLRKSGIEIITEQVEVNNRFGEKCVFASYRLKDYVPNLKAV